MGNAVFRLCSRCRWRWREPGARGSLFRLVLNGQPQPKLLSSTPLHCWTRNLSLGLEDLASFGMNGPPVSALAVSLDGFSECGPVLFVVNHHLIYVVDVETCNVIGTLKGRHRINSIRCRNSANHALAVAVADEGGFITVWSWESSVCSVNSQLTSSSSHRSMNDDEDPLITSQTRSSDWDCHMRTGDLILNSGITTWGLAVTPVAIFAGANDRRVRAYELPSDLPPKNRGHLGRRCSFLSASCFGSGHRSNLPCVSAGPCDSSKELFSSGSLDGSVRVWSFDADSKETQEIARWCMTGFAWDAGAHMVWAVRWVPLVSVATLPLKHGDSREGARNSAVELSDLSLLGDQHDEHESNVANLLSGAGLSAGASWLSMDLVLAHVLPWLDPQCLAVRVARLSQAWRFAAELELTDDNSGRGYDGNCDCMAASHRMEGREMLLICTFGRLLVLLGGFNKGASKLQRLATLASLNISIPPIAPDPGPPPRFDLLAYVPQLSIVLVASKSGAAVAVLRILRRVGTLHFAMKFVRTLTKPTSNTSNRTDCSLGLAARWVPATAAAGRGHCLVYLLTADRNVSCWRLESQDVIV